jgi:hypothetical protein
MEAFVDEAFVYLIITPGFDKCKFGLWRSTYKKLQKRYNPIYGDPSILATAVQCSRGSEAELIADLKLRFSQAGLLFQNDRELVWSERATLDTFLEFVIEVGFGMVGTLTSNAILTMSTKSRERY